MVATPPQPQRAMSPTARRPNDATAELILNEYECLKKDRRLGGVYVAPSSDSLYLWHGVIFIRMNQYAPGTFKFVLAIPDNYPADRPTVRFVSRVKHPLVNSSGEVDLSIFRASAAAAVPENKIRTALHDLKSIFYPIHTKGSWAQFDPKLKKQDAMDQFRKEVKDCVAESIDNTFINPDNFGLRFSEFKAPHRALLDHILKDCESDNEPI
mmetsp:Transcript_19556/g.45721  ORF Transcript_19556/g.45721 Transcript_19556/m.45721 type:complete len:211 (+) Transcript_19556:17-649(+)|eukprot:CAMPEP_0114561384 /NCGR_PEP_ID=MMETSP0114-20121206/11975_1 /TAXON_ID=31324 /ORGANISM="Goniomonas sp, Strain m" /LENGTH=210 /DNA_ID=CAMNT_0001747015 /DNA_START=17 /DNA_END=649 /DNA_ORIENTATION=+